MFERESAKLVAITDRARTQLTRYRDAGRDDDEFLADLVDSFVAQPDAHPATAGRTHMALTIYRNLLLQERLDELLDRMNERQTID